jgi:hypothetical protein
VPKEQLKKEEVSMIAKSYGINWIWYLEYDEVPNHKVVRINKHFRLHKLDCKNHPTTDVEFELVEAGNDRMVTGVFLNGEKFLVQNCKKIWDYGVSCN